MSIRKKILNSLPELPKGVKILLFGSTLSSESMNDIDLIILYDKRKLNVELAIELRLAIRIKIEKYIKLPADILLLSIEEDKETGFTKNTKTEKIIES